WYLTGFDHPNATAVLRTTEKGARFTLFVEPRDKAAETWTGYRPGVEGAVEDFGADQAFESSQLASALRGFLEEADRLYYTFGRSAELDQELTRAQDELRIQSRRGVQPVESILDPRAILHEMRLIKSPTEMEIMREAADISREAHREAASILEPGRAEYEIEARLDYVFRRRGGWGAAYGSIVAGGSRATVLHYVRNDQQLEQGDLVLIDAGAELRGYASDVTRTYPVSGHFEGAGREVYAVVLAAQKAAILNARPGSSLADLHAATLRELVQGMVDLGLLKGEVDTLIESEAFRPYYMHGTSHWLGLDVHDAGSYMDGDQPRPLEEGMVFTVEPGLYIPPDDDQAPERLRGIGVRIEDNIAITRTGSENLTAEIPKEIEDVENWVQEDP
ncbi:MAG: aminopeptidase P N-terminal domain-containing protein, partial [Myxococcota bacterium]|nr:aminopeptidase P N-terminal domain-containing protein [Myxococcota bacterium]